MVEFTKSDIPIYKIGHTFTKSDIPNRYRKTISFENLRKFGIDWKDALLKQILFDNGVLQSENEELKHENEQLEFQLRQKLID